MDCSPLLDADASFTFLDDDKLHTHLPPINELFSSILDNSPPINETGFELLDSERSKNVSLLGVSFGLDG